MFKVICVLALVFMTFASINCGNQLEVTLGETTLDACDGMRICQASCNSPRLKCRSNDQNFNRGLYKNFDGRSFFLPPYPIQLAVTTADEAYDIACVRHSSSKAHLLKMMDNVRKVSESNMTRINEKRAALKAERNLKQATKKGERASRRGVTTLEAQTMKFDWNSKEVVAQRGIDGGKIKKEMFNELITEDKQVRILSALLVLMKPESQFVKFWYTMREFCKTKVAGLIPRERALRTFFAFNGWDTVTKRAIVQLNISAEVEPIAGEKPTDSVTAGGKESGLTGLRGFDSATKGDNDMMGFITTQMGQPSKGGVATLHKGDKGEKDGLKKDISCDKVSNSERIQEAAGLKVEMTTVLGRGHGHEISAQEAAERISYCATHRGVVDFFYDLADWATSSLNYRCPCSDIQNLIFTGVAPDGTRWPNMKKINGAALLKQRDDACLAMYKGICAARLPNDLKDISDDGIFVPTAQGPPNNREGVAKVLSEDVEEEEEGILELEL